ncbi:Levanase [anaerobic digester metagenome]
MIRNFFIHFIILFGFIAFTNAQSISMKVTQNYLNIPVSHTVSRQIMTIEVDGKKERTFEIRLAEENPDYWVFCDISMFKNKTLNISFSSERKGLHQIYQSDEIAGQDSLYKEQNRPQFHFSSRRGWNNDPNGLIYYEGEYHLFYQHNPYEREWGNMHWGHAVSKDLIHWKELPIALYPDENGTIFSGSAVIDYENTAGFNKNKTPAMVAIYTADNPDRQIQCIAYSLDKGRTWRKYDKNPVIDSKEKWNSKDTRDPKVFWHRPSKKWVMVLNERDGHSIYNSVNLKEWTYESHVTGFWECPELFELPVDGNENNKKWVMYGASGTYMVGAFDGKKFTPEGGKHYYITGSAYAGQTYTNIPSSDGRRIQISWGRIPSQNMPFNMLMLLPVELALRNTKSGIRLFGMPIKEVTALHNENFSWHNLNTDEANKHLQKFNNESLVRVKFTLKLSHATGAGLNLRGQSLVNYDMNFNLVNGVFYSPNDMTSMEISADIFIDKTSVEVFIDDGAYSYSFEKKNMNSDQGFYFWGNNITIKNLEVYTLKSIWNK